MPTIGEVGHREELQREGQFHETERDFHLVHPRTAARRLLEQGGEEREEGERQCQRHGKTEHAHGGRELTAARSRNLHQQETDDGAGAREADKSQREGHEEDAQQARCVRSLGVDCVTPRSGQLNLETAEERSAEEHQHQEESDVEEGIGRQIVERRSTEKRGDDQSEQDIDHHNRCTVSQRIADALGAVVVALQEEAHRHRNDGPNARRHERQESTEEA